MHADTLATYVRKTEPACHVLSRPERRKGLQVQAHTIGPSTSSGIAERGSQVNRTCDFTTNSNLPFDSALSIIQIRKGSSPRTLTGPSIQSPPTDESQPSSDAITPTRAVHPDLPAPAAHTHSSHERAQLNTKPTARGSQEAEPHTHTVVCTLLPPIVLSSQQPARRGRRCRR